MEGPGLGGAEKALGYEGTTNATIGQQIAEGATAQGAVAETADVSARASQSNTNIGDDDDGDFNYGAQRYASATSLSAGGVESPLTYTPKYDRVYSTTTHTHPDPSVIMAAGSAEPLQGASSSSAAEQDELSLKGANSGEATGGWPNAHSAHALPLVGQHTSDDEDEDDIAAAVRYMRSASIAAKGAAAAAAATAARTAVLSELISDGNLDGVARELSMSHRNGGEHALDMNTSRLHMGSATSAAPGYIHAPAWSVGTAVEEPAATRNGTMHQQLDMDDMDLRGIACGDEQRSYSAGVPPGQQQNEENEWRQQHVEQRLSDGGGALSPVQAAVYEPDEPPFGDAEDEALAAVVPEGSLSREQQHTSWSDSGSASQQRQPEDVAPAQGQKPAALASAAAAVWVAPAEGRWLSRNGTSIWTGAFDTQVLSPGPRPGSTSGAAATHSSGAVDAAPVRSGAFEAPPLRSPDTGSTSGAAAQYGSDDVTTAWTGAFDEPAEHSTTTGPVPAADVQYGAGSDAPIWTGGFEAQPVPSSWSGGADQHGAGSGAAAWTGAFDAAPVYGHTEGSLSGTATQHGASSEAPLWTGAFDEAPLEGAATAAAYATGSLAHGDKAAMWTGAFNAAAVHSPGAASSNGAAAPLGASKTPTAWTGAFEAPPAVHTPGADPSPSSAGPSYANDGAADRERSSGGTWPAAGAPAATGAVWTGAFDAPHLTPGSTHAEGLAAQATDDGPGGDSPGREPWAGDRAEPADNSEQGAELSAKEAGSAFAYAANVPEALDAWAASIATAAKSSPDPVPPLSLDAADEWAASLGGPVTLSWDAAAAEAAAAEAAEAAKAAAAVAAAAAAVAALEMAHTGAPGSGASNSLPSHDSAAPAPSASPSALLDDYRIAAAAGLISPGLASLLGFEEGAQVGHAPQHQQARVMQGPAAQQHPLPPAPAEVGQPGKRASGGGGAGGMGLGAAAAIGGAAMLAAGAVAGAAVAAGNAAAGAVSAAPAVPVAAAAKVPPGAVPMAAQQGAPRQQQAPLAATPQRPAMPPGLDPQQQQQWLQQQHFMMQRQQAGLPGPGPAQGPGPAGHHMAAQGGPRALFSPSGPLPTSVRPSASPPGAPPAPGAMPAGMPHPGAPMPHGPPGAPGMPMQAAAAGAAVAGMAPHGAHPPGPGAPIPPGKMGSMQHGPMGPLGAPPLAPQPGMRPPGPRPPGAPGLGGAHMPMPGPGQGQFPPGHGPPGAQPFGGRPPMIGGPQPMGARPMGPGQGPMPMQAGPRPGMPMPPHGMPGMAPQPWHGGHPPPPSPFPGLLYTDGRDTLGRPVVVVNTAMLQPKAKKDEVLAYVLGQLQPVVQRDYVLVVLSMGTGVRAGVLSSTWALGMYKSLAKPFRKNVKHIVLVQPSGWARTMLALAQPFVSKKAAHKIKKVENLMEVAEATGGEVKLDSLGACFVREVQHGVGAHPLAGYVPPEQLQRMQHPNPQQPPGRAGVPMVHPMGPGGPAPRPMGQPGAPYQPQGRALPGQGAQGNAMQQQVQGPPGASPAYHRQGSAAPPPGALMQHGSFGPGGPRTPPAAMMRPPMPGPGGIRPPMHQMAGGPRPFMQGSGPRPTGPPPPARGPGAPAGQPGSVQMQHYVPPTPM